MAEVRKYLHMQSVYKPGINGTNLYKNLPAIKGLRQSVLYHLTRKGGEALKEEKRARERYSGAIQAVLEASPV